MPAAELCSYYRFTNDAFVPSDTPPVIADMLREIGFEFEIDLFYVTSAGLASPTFFDKLSEKLKDNQPAKPALFLAWKNIFALDSVELIRILNPDKRFRFLDSSIWFRTLFLESDFENNLKKLLAEIQQNYENGLYELNVSLEFAEFQLRIMKNAYLSDTGGHASAVAPFVFHSESKMDAAAEKNISELKQSRIKRRLLLVDDFADSGLKINDKNSGLSKADVISDILIKDGTSDLFEIETAVSIDDAQEKMSQEKIYDVILLDFLLGDKPNIKHGVREYSHELLWRILTIDDFVKNQEPFRRYWFFPVSVFSTAMLDTMQERSIPHISKEWYLSRGADPVNTPHLFRAKFYEFLKLQIKEAGLANISGPDDLFYQINRLFTAKNAYANDIKAFCRNIAYPETVLINTRLNNLEAIADRSLFAESFLSNTTLIDKSDWQIILQFFYLTAYGSNMHEEDFESVYEVLQTLIKKDMTYDLDFFKALRKHYF